MAEFVKPTTWRRGLLAVVLLGLGAIGIQFAAGADSFAGLVGGMAAVLVGVPLVYYFVGSYIKQWEFQKGLTSSGSTNSASR
jgi:hypothetical protein